MSPCTVPPLELHPIASLQLDNSFSHRDMPLTHSLWHFTDENKENALTPYFHNIRSSPHPPGTLLYIIFIYSAIAYLPLIWKSRCLHLWLNYIKGGDINVWQYGIAVQCIPQQLRCVKWQPKTQHGVCVLTCVHFNAYVRDKRHHLPAQKYNFSETLGRGSWTLTNASNSSLN